MRPTHIIIHHSKTKDSKTVSWGRIRLYQMKALAHDDIAYHAGTELMRDEYELVIGRDWFTPGAHCFQNGMNFKSLGFLLVGDFDLKEPPVKQWNKAVSWCCLALKLFGIPVENIEAHSKYAHYKTCPGKMFDMDKFRADILDVLEGGLQDET